MTTVVSGNCGVGFAPVRPGSEQWLIELMEGVEDILGLLWPRASPGSGRASRKTLTQSKSAIFQSITAPRSPTGGRGYAMVTRCRNEDATADDIAAMARIVQEAVEAGALGFSTSRTEAHRAIDGQAVPGPMRPKRNCSGWAARWPPGEAVFEVAPRAPRAKPPKRRRCAN